MTLLNCYDLLWQCIDASGQSATLFGERCRGLARQAFAASACGSEMPIVYFELPLAGELAFDLQVCIEKTALKEGYHLPSNVPAHERELLDWLTGPEGTGCTGVDLAFDLRSHGIEQPQLIVLMEEGILPDAEGFFALTGAPDGAARYRAATAQSPDGWYSWYTGILPGRPGTPVRLDFSIARPTVHAYATDTDLLARDLKQVGYELSSCEATWCEQLLQLPCGLNLQLDIASDGSIGPVLGYNLIEGGIGPHATKERLESGWMQHVMHMAQDWGIADDRWQLLKNLCQAKMFITRDEAGRQLRFVMSLKPTFIKIRMTPEALVDAKAYLMCKLIKVS